MFYRPTQPATGSVWPAPAPPGTGGYQMNFSPWRGSRQTIFFAASSDLRHWEWLGKEYEFARDERWYAREGQWDCIWTVPRSAGGLYGYWTATPKHGTGGRY